MGQDEEARATVEGRQGVLDTIKRIHGAATVTRAAQRGGAYQGLAGLTAERIAAKGKQPPKLCESSFRELSKRATEVIERSAPGALPVVGIQPKVCTSCGCGCK